MQHSTTNKPVGWSLQEQVHVVCKRGLPPDGFSHRTVFFAIASPTSRSQSKQKRISLSSLTPLPSLTPPVPSALMWPPIASSRFEWSEQICLPKHDSGPIRGHLSDIAWIEAALQALLVFGPAAWLLIAAPFRVAQMWERKAVVLSNRRGYFKAVGISEGESLPPR